MSYVARVSKEGADAGTATIGNLTLDSEINNLKINNIGSATFICNTNTKGTINHNFGYTPSFMSFFKFGTFPQWFTQGCKESLSGNNLMVLGRSNGSQLIFDITSSGSISGTLVYLLIVDPAL